MPARSFSPDQHTAAPAERTRAELDAEYSPSRVVPDFLSILDDYRRLSDVAKRTVACELNVRYGEAEGELLHHFPPRRAGSPLLVFVHGGHWQQLSIDDSCFAAPALVDNGAGLMVVGYRLAPEGTLDAMVASVSKALGWVAANAAALGGTPQRIHAAGSSAGAHLVAMATASAPATSPVRLAGVALLSGVYDLGGIRFSYVNEALRLTEEDARRNSPVHYLPIRAQEVLIARGETETTEYGNQHDLLADALRENEGGSSVSSLVCRGRNHFDLPLGLGDPEDELGRAVLRQMGLGERT
ncbi:MAG TPA: alpha/beta hydrolase [Pseudonocardiaceae bacterium]|nr:alpha/beta hydrolase [Pseudonocardiaceae bacterium]